jgi:hypothetical protein
MPSAFIRHLAKSKDNSQTEPTQEFNRWRIAIELIQRMREAGIHCELSDDFKNRH